ncbi:MAG: c-type cytochrome [Burkholderiales bacterium]
MIAAVLLGGGLATAAAMAVEPLVARPPGPVSPARQAELMYIVRHDCGSCHGMTLNGGLGPALTPQVLRHKSAPYLAAVILDGRHGTAMPGWRPLLSEAEVSWIAAQLREGMPDAH